MFYLNYSPSAVYCTCSLEFITMHYLLHKPKLLFVINYNLWTVDMYVRGAREQGREGVKKGSRMKF